jgi:hypothetical protein
MDEQESCQCCGELTDVEYLIVAECNSILCSGCVGLHDCDICFPSEADSDSDYVSTTTSYDEEEEEEEEEDD